MYCTIKLRLLCFNIKKIIINQWQGPAIWFGETWSGVTASTVRHPATSNKSAGVCMPAALLASALSNFQYRLGWSELKDLLRLGYDSRVCYGLATTQDLLGLNVHWSWSIQTVMMMSQLGSLTVTDQLLMKQGMQWCRVMIHRDTLSQYNTLWKDNTWYFYENMHLTPELGLQSNSMWTGQVTANVHKVTLQHTKCHTG